MRVLQTLLLFVLICGCISSVIAQADYGCGTRIYVNDFQGNQIKDAKVSLLERVTFYSNRFEAYVFIRLLLFNKLKELQTGKLMVKAKGFKTFEEEVKFRCDDGFFRVTLKKKKSNETASVEFSKSLSGTITDENGAIISFAKVKAFDKSGKAFEAKTNAEGFYRLVLFPQIYRLEFEAEGFATLLINDFQIENSTDDKANGKDVVLTGLNLEPCGYSGANCLNNSNKLIENTNKKVSDKVLQKPLENFPKENNKK